MIDVGSRVRWNGGLPGAEGLVGHEGTVVSLSATASWAWVEYDDGTEKDAYLCHLQEIGNDKTVSQSGPSPNLDGHRHPSSE